MRVFICPVWACSSPVTTKGMCMKHYKDKYNAERRLAKGQMLMPPHDLPFRALARSCPRCGTLMSTPLHLIKKDAGEVPRCASCKSARMTAINAGLRKARKLDPKLIEAERARANDRKIRRQAASKNATPNNGQEWTLDEMNVAERQDITVLEAAKILGRSYYSVDTMRRRLRESGADE